MNNRRQKSGYAILAVIGVMTLLIVYLATVQGSIVMTARQAKNLADQQSVAQDSAAVLGEIALKVKDPSTSATMPFVTPNGLRITARIHPAPVGDEVWTRIKGIEPKPGDLAVALNAAETMDRGEQYVINSQGARPGVIRVGRIGGN